MSHAIGYLGWARASARTRLWALIALGLSAGTLAAWLVLAGGAQPHGAAPRGPEALPVQARGVVARALGGEDRRLFARPSPDGLAFTNPAAGITAGLSRRGVVVRSGSLSWSMGLRAYGHGTRLAAVGESSPRASHNRVVYPRGAVREWYANGPLGLEQGFTLERAPHGPRAGLLTLAVGRLPEGVQARVDGDRRGVTLVARGRELLRYTGLTASDGRGRSLPVRIEPSDGRLLLRIDDRHARYPVRVDPFVQAAKLTASDGTEEDNLGWSVAVSGDGATIVAGAPYADIGEAETQGAVYVFVKSGGGWSSATETAKLTASDGKEGDLLGSAVAVSGDGSTIVAGAPSAPVGANNGQGAVYVFVKPGAGWSSATETAKLTASDGAADNNLGYSVAVSADGSTVAAGAPAAKVAVLGDGAAYVFSEPEGGWEGEVQEQAKLTASSPKVDDALGRSIAISPDGSTIVAGAPFVEVGGRINQGVAYVYVKPEAPWSDATETATLTAPKPEQLETLGSAVAVSGDGSTIVAGSEGAFINEERGVGAAHVFLRPEGGWEAGEPQTAKLTPSDGNEFGSLGASLSVSSDGSRVVAGAPQANVSGHEGAGAAYLFVKAPGGWSDATQTAKLIAGPTARARLGYGVAIAGALVVAGAPSDTVGTTEFQGAAYAFVASTTTAASCQPASATVGQATTCTATVTDTGAGGVAPSGSVSFSSDSGGSLGSGGSCALAPTSTAGVASCQLTYTPTSVGSGTHTLTASYAGDTGHAASQGATPLGVAAAPVVGPGGGGVGGSPPTLAKLSALSETNSVFAVGPGSTPLSGVTAAARHRRGTIFSFRLDQPATVKVAIQRLAPGRRVGHSCKPDRPNLRHKRRCTRTVPVATLTRIAHAGANKLAFSGRIKGKALRPGRYRAVFTARDAAGASAPKAVAFTIAAR